jgi:hypothetical protein
VDRGLRWVTFEGETDSSEDIPIPSGWLTFIFLEASDSGTWEHADFNEGVVHSDYIDLKGGVRYRISLAYPY